MLLLPAPAFLHLRTGRLCMYVSKSGERARSARAPALQLLLESRLFHGLDARNRRWTTKTIWIDFRRASAWHSRIHTAFATPPHRFLLGTHVRTQPDDKYYMDRLPASERGARGFDARPSSSRSVAASPSRPLACGLVPGHGRLLLRASSCTFLSASLTALSASRLLVSLELAVQVSSRPVLCSRRR